MNGTDTDLAALIGSRICHDLISPIGAINNGLELLQMSGTHDGPEMGLIGESVGSASARIRFFRIAFGAAGDQMVGPGEVIAILRDLYDSGRLDITWDCDTSQPRAQVRLAFLALMCLETALPYGGAITVAAQDGDWTLTGAGDRVNADGDMWHQIKGGSDAVKTLAPAHVQFALLPQIAHEEGRTLTMLHRDSDVVLRF